MKESVSFLQMFSEYRPGEDLSGVLSVVRITGADLDPATRQAVVTLYADQYIPMRLLEKVERDICSLYGLRHFEIHMTHPAEELQKVEPEELMQLFVEENSMNRASLAGAGWKWDGDALVISLRANGKAALEEVVPAVCRKLTERFGKAPVFKILSAHELSGQALFDALETMRSTTAAAMPE